MKVRTVLFPIDSGHDVLIMQYQSQEGLNWESVPMISSGDLSLTEIKEIGQVLASNESIGRQYIENRVEIFRRMNEPKPDVVNVTASDVQDVPSEEPKGE